LTKASSSPRVANVVESATGAGGVIHNCGHGTRNGQGRGKGKTPEIPHPRKINGKSVA
jgi:hypothetical protein